MSVDRSRINYIDICKGIGIIMVIMGHFPIPKFLRIYIYSFHMPLFFFISGYLNKNNYKKGYIKHRFYALITPYLMFSILNTIIWYLVSGDENNLKLRLYETLIGNGGSIALWFLVCLFFTEVSFFILNKTFESNYIKGFIIVLIGIIGISFSDLNIILPFKFNTVSISLGIYYLGYLANNLIKYKTEKNTVIGWFILSIIFSWLQFRLNNKQIDMNNYFYGNIFVFYITSVVGIFFCFALSKKIKKNNILEYLGKNSLIILCIHGFIPEVIRQILINMNINLTINIKILSIIISLFLIFIGIYVINNYLSFLLGKDICK